MDRDALALSAPAGVSSLARQGVNGEECHVEAQRLSTCNGERAIVRREPSTNGIDSNAAVGTRYPSVVRPKRVTRARATGELTRYRTRKCKVKALPETGTPFDCVVEYRLFGLPERR